jgi:hypothetical protein
LLAHGSRQSLNDLPIVVSNATIDLTKPDAFKMVVDTIRAANSRFGMETGLVIIDTFAKLIAAGGGDENSAKDQGAVFANVQRVKLNADVHVALVGHTGKDETRGARGSNAILGDVGVNRKGDAAQPQSPAQRPQPGSGIQRCLACTEVRLRLRTLPPL